MVVGDAVVVVASSVVVVVTTAAFVVVVVPEVLHMQTGSPFFSRNNVFFVLRFFSAITELMALHNDHMWARGRPSWGGIWEFFF